MRQNRTSKGQLWQGENAEQTQWICSVWMCNYKNDH